MSKRCISRRVDHKETMFGQTVMKQGWISIGTLQVNKRDSVGGIGGQSGCLDNPRSERAGTANGKAITR